MATTLSQTIQNNPVPTTLNVDDLLFLIGQQTLATTGSPNTFAAGYVAGLNAAILILQTQRDLNYTQTPPVGPVV